MSTLQGNSLAFRPGSTSSRPRKTRRRSQKARTIKPQTISFIQLAGDNREQIYFEILRPDMITEWRGNTLLEWDKQDTGRYNAIGCTKILTLNRQIYTEAVKLLECMPVYIFINYDTAHPTFRDMRAFGKPGFFHAIAPRSSCYAPAMLTELEYRRVAKLTVDLHYPILCPAKSIEYHNAQLDLFKSSLANLFQLVEASDVLRKVEFVIQGAYIGFCELTNQPKLFMNNDPAEIHALLLPLLTAALRKSIHLTARSNQRFRDGGNRSYHDPFTYEHSYHDPLVSIINSLPKPNDPLTALAPTIISTTPSLYNPDIKHRYTRENFPDRIYTLVPECRSCYQIFPTREILHNHLSTTPTHRTRFRRSRYNTVPTHLPRQEAVYKCCVCACGFSLSGKCHKHMDIYCHNRDPATEGMVPRWRKDNELFRWVNPEKGKGMRHPHCFLGMASGVWGQVAGVGIDGNGGNERVENDEDRGV